MMMLRLALAWIACLGLPASGTCGEGTVDIQDGLYQVVVNLDLPHLEGMGATKTSTVCISTSGANPTHGLTVLSENNPLGKCPASNLSRDGGTFKFEVHCEGKNAAEGFASYQLFPDRFQGAIVMKMGGKNMTMTETQTGKRVGTCTPAATH